MYQQDIISPFLQSNNIFRLICSYNLPIFKNVLPVGHFVFWLNSLILTDTGALRSQVMFLFHGDIVVYVIVQYIYYNWSGVKTTAQLLKQGCQYFQIMSQEDQFLANSTQFFLQNMKMYTCYFKNNHSFGPMIFAC